MHIFFQKSWINVDIFSAWGEGGGGEALHMCTYCFQEINIKYRYNLSIFDIFLTTRRLVQTQVSHR